MNTTASAFSPASSRSIRNALSIVAGTLVLTALARLRVELPYSVVPVTGQTLGMLLIGAALGGRRAAGTLFLYLLEGACGMPVFAGTAGGAALLLGPTGGYLIGMLLGAFVIGSVLDTSRTEPSLPLIAGAFVLGLIPVFGLGALWLSRFVGTETAIAAGVLPFVPGELVKLAVGATMIRASSRLSRGA